MQNPRLASRYAKSLIDIAQEQNALEAVLDDMELIQQICQSNHDFVLMLKSPVVKSDKKMAILHTVLDGRVQPVTMGFINLLVNKGREFYLPEIVEAFSTQYKELKHIRTVNLTTAVAIDDNVKKLIFDKVTASIADGHVELNTFVNEDLIGGFTLEVDDKLFDASIRRDLNDIKQQFTKNLFVADM
ncbi:ATP synthase F1 subunit delta [Taibaiella koreensis]|uniref:ATP synthase F1 subunit delta n=1 Tax=Taibaiella koreensis TaxID=1268548 RepID=UPI000E599825|nr:ATP synthase F1 subunit delta [Taibaiella koreensis]